MSIYLGLMSGTSMDGIDAALLDVETQRFLGGLTRSYSAEIYDRLQSLIQAPKVTLEEIWQLNTLLGKEFADAANELLEQQAVDRQLITAIGSHGQTIRHAPLSSIPYTIQLACPHTIAELTGVTVVADFRTRDMVNGGEGAPLAPIYHQAILAQDDKSLAVVNMGGIANITFLSPDTSVYGYDIGPGNCLMDTWIQQQLGMQYDQNGDYAARGKVIPTLLQGLLEDKFFQLPYPKSVCKSYFSLQWLQQKLLKSYAPQDVQMTLLMLSARIIVDAIQASSRSIQMVAICGGGAHNQTLLRVLQSLLPQIEVLSTQALGVDPDYLEAMMFAWLAHQTLNRKHLDLRQITGAKKPAILGAIYPI